MAKHQEPSEDDEFPDTVPMDEEHILVNCKSEVPMSWQVKAAVEAYRIVEGTARARIARKETSRDKVIAHLKALNHLILGTTLVGEHETEIRGLIREQTEREKEPEPAPKRRESRRRRG